LKVEVLDRTLWRTRFGWGYGLVVRQTKEWMNERTLFKLKRDWFEICWAPVPNYLDILLSRYILQSWQVFCFVRQFMWAAAHPRERICTSVTGTARAVQVSCPPCSTQWRARPH
jgi:hypothetical protein